jgi:hypothetical protein
MIRGFAFFVGLVLALGGCDRAKIAAISLDTLTRFF